MNKKVKEVLAYGTVINDVVSEDRKHEYYVRTTSYLYGDVVYFITRINGKVVDFTDTSKTCK